MLQSLAGEFQAYYPAPLNLWLQIQARPSESGVTIFFRDISQQKRDQETFHQKQLETERQRRIGSRL